MCYYENLHSEAGVKNVNEIFIALLLWEVYQFCFLATAQQLWNSCEKRTRNFKKSYSKIVMKRKTKSKRTKEKKVARKEWKLFMVSIITMILTCIIMHSTCVIHTYFDDICSDWMTSHKWFFFYLMISPEYFRSHSTQRWLERVHNTVAEEGLVIFTHTYCLALSTARPTVVTSFTIICS